jgi:tetratricopeptide (TPR) repeat protein
MLLALGTTPRTLSAETTFFERRSMSLAQQSFQNSLYDISEDKLVGFLAKYPNSDFKTEARWLLGQSYFFQGKFSEALEIFKSPPKSGEEKFRSGYVFWEAETLAALTRWSEAVERYQYFLKTHPQDPLADDARIGLAAAFHRTQKTTEALAILEPMIQGGFTTPSAKKAGLQKVRILIGSQDFPAAHKALQVLSSEKPDPSSTYEVAYWTAELALLENEPDRALEWFRKITSDSRVRPRNLLPLSWFGSGIAQEKKENWTAAADAFEQAFTLALDPAVIEPAVVRYLEANVKSNTLAKAGTEKVKTFTFSDALEDDALKPGLKPDGQASAIVHTSLGSHPCSVLRVSKTIVFEGWGRQSARSSTTFILRIAKSMKSSLKRPTHPCKFNETTHVHASQHIGIQTSQYIINTMAACTEFSWSWFGMRR